MKKLLFYEKKKLFRNYWLAALWILVLILFIQWSIPGYQRSFIMDDEGNFLFGRTADKKLEELYPNPITDEIVKRDILYLRDNVNWELYDESEELTAGMDEKTKSYFNERYEYFISLMFHFDTYENPIYTLSDLCKQADKLGDYNEVRQEKMKNEVLSGDFNENEKEYLLKKIEETKGPYYFRHGNGWIALINVSTAMRNFLMVMAMTLLVIGFYEKKNRTKNLFKTMKNYEMSGKVEAKMMVGIVLFIIGIAIFGFCIPIVLRRGAGMWNMPIQSANFYEWLPLKQYQLGLLEIWIFILKVLLTASFSFFMSKKIPNIWIAAPIILIPIAMVQKVAQSLYFTADFHSQSGKIISLLPVFVDYFESSTLTCYSLFGIPINFYVAATILHLILIALLIWGGLHKNNRVGI